MDFTHIDEAGNARMVDVSGKETTHRAAVAVGRISMSRACFEAVERGAVRKGDALGVARVAGIMAAKRTGQLIPLCHPLELTNCAVTFRPLPEESAVECTCTVSCDGRTGVEMEALTGCSVALLTVYDMCKAVDKRMVIERVHLAEKTGGKSGVFRFEDEG